MKNIFTILSFLLCIDLCGSAQVTSINENFDATIGSNMPSGWGGSAVLGTNFGTGNFYPDHTSGSGRFVFGSNGYMCTSLVAAGAYDLSFWMRISSMTENISLGYCTSQSDIAGTFTPLQTVNNNSTVWVNYTYSLTLPVNAYLTISCAGGAKTHCVDDVLLSPVVGIAREMDTPEFKIGPVPSTGLVHLSNLAEQTCTLRVFNLTGEPAFQSTVAGENSTIDLSSLPNGIYYIEVQNAQVTMIRKIILEK